MFTARYGLVPYIKQITFRLLKVNVLPAYANYTFFSTNFCSSICGTFFHTFHFTISCKVIHSVLMENVTVHLCWVSNSHCKSLTPDLFPFVITKMSFFVV